MSTTEFKLLPCPFCGGPVKMERATDTYEKLHGTRQWWGVVCRNAINRGGTCAIETVPSASEEVAAERWNRRAPAAPQSTVPQDAKDAERKRFEIWACKRVSQELIDRTRADRGYTNQWLYDAWEAWQGCAAIAAQGGE